LTIIPEETRPRPYIVELPVYETTTSSEHALFENPPLINPDLVAVSADYPTSSGHTLFENPPLIDPAVSADHPTISANAGCDLTADQPYDRIDTP
ncbi:23102_t:CDS:1, partial [Racocetra persica]